MMTHLQWGAQNERIRCEFPQEKSLTSFLYSTIHKWHSCPLITAGHRLTQTQQGGGKKQQWRICGLPAGQGPRSSCLSRCQVSKNYSGQKHDIQGCESACEWQSLPLMERKKCKSSLVTFKTCWTRFCTALRSKSSRTLRRHQAAFLQFTRNHNTRDYYSWIWHKPFPWIIKIYTLQKNWNCENYEQNVYSFVILLLVFMYIRRTFCI